MKRRDCVAVVAAAVVVVIVVACRHNEVADVVLSRVLHKQQTFK
jgi:hypothetical protein